MPVVVPPVATDPNAMEYISALEADIFTASQKCCYILWDLKVF